MTKHLIRTMAVALACTCGISTAAPVAVGAGVFGGATLINFNGLANTAMITTQFTVLGVTVSGGLYADSSTAPGFLNGTPGASNFFGPSNNPPYNPVTFTFSAPVFLFGLTEVSNVGSFLITEGNGSFLSYPTSLAAGFAGLQDTAGFTSITISVLSGANAAFSMDDLRFSAIGVVPEPESVALIGAGLLAYSLLRRRQSRKAS
jgi:PEP-CTERM motif